MCCNLSNSLKKGFHFPFHSFAQEISEKLILVKSVKGEAPILLKQNLEKACVAKDLDMENKL